MAGKNSRRRAVIVIAASVLVIVCVAIATAVLVQRAPKSGPAGSEAPSSSAPASAGPGGSGTTEASGGYQVVSFPEGTFSASNEDEMRQVIEELGPALGITDAASQLDEPRVTKASGATTYRFPQRLNGIPVLDRSVVAATSGSEVISVSGNTVAASSDVTEPSVGADAVQASVEAALGEKYGEVQGVLLDSYDKGDLVYYTFDVERPVLAWQVFASFSTESDMQGASLVVSAEDASVLRVTDGIQEAKVPGVEGEEDIPVDDWKGEDESVPLVSTVRGSGDDGVQVRVWEPTNASFSQLSQSAQEAGRIMVASGELSQSQADAIARAFAAQGIEAGQDTRATYCMSDVDLTVTDINGHAYGNYSIGFAATGVTKVPTPQDVVVGPEGASGKIPLRLRATDFDANAVYEVTVADLGSSGADPVTARLIFSPSAAMSGEEAADMRIPTAFGTRDVVPASVPRTNVKPDVTLVLDVSGSMDGAPMDSLRGAVATFLDTAEKADLTVGIVSFSNDAKAVSSLGKDYAAHRAAIFSDDFGSGGGTNVEAGLNEAEQLLGGSSASSKAIVLMTDGIANDGATGDDLVSVAADLKSKGISLYTLGFFNSLSGSELADAQALLERMATQGEHFEATGSSLEDFFAAIASQLQGDRYTYIRVACPVDVTVVHEGQVLSSAAGGVASVSDFGSVTTMASGAGDGAGETGDPGDPIKIVRLLQGQDYEIYLTGTGEGTMDYSVSYMDETGAYVDERSFEDVPVSAGSLMQTSSSQAPETTLDVDSDGDGTTDLRLSAASGEAAHTMTREEFSQRRAVVVAGALVLLTALVAVLEWRARARRAA